MPAKTLQAKPSVITTTQRLNSIIKAARDIMRKDKGLNGDLDRLPMLTWVMFLKFLDDLEQIREAEASVEGRPFVQTIDPPYRWRDWAAAPDGVSGDALIAFVNQEECVLPDGSKGAGLFAYLRQLQGVATGDRRDVVATVFRGTVNRMINGYLLRDVINKVNAIHFESSDEIHTLGRLYESMLREMRDAAGDSGEFYTPRPVVRFMVQMVDPVVGQRVLDPACGTGGFLVEAYLHMLAAARTVEDRGRVDAGVGGGEAKPLPYLLAQMNLLLHGIESPRIEFGNSLAIRLSEIGERDRVDVLLTNPPFGGEEEKGIQNNFPADRQTSETALLFLQLIMRKLKRHGTGARDAQAAMVVPNGLLFADGVAGRIRADLVTNFNLHTVVRLPEGVFSPYTDIPTNLLFFEAGRPTTTTWFYQIAPPQDRKRFTKTSPIAAQHFDACAAWWTKRVETEVAWRTSAQELADRKYRLDPPNPRTKPSDRRAPAEVIADLRASHHDLEASIGRLEDLVRELE